MQFLDELTVCGDNVLLGGPVVQAQYRQRFGASHSTAVGGARLLLPAKARVAGEALV